MRVIIIWIPCLNCPRMSSPRHPGKSLPEIVHVHYIPRMDPMSQPSQDVSEKTSWDIPGKSGWYTHVHTSHVSTVLGCLEEDMLGHPGKVHLIYTVTLTSHVSTVPGCLGEDILGHPGKSPADIHTCIHPMSQPSQDVSEKTSWDITEKVHMIYTHAYIPCLNCPRMSWRRHAGTSQESPPDIHCDTSHVSTVPGCLGENILGHPETSAWYTYIPCLNCPRISWRRHPGEKVCLTHKMLYSTVSECFGEDILHVASQEHLWQLYCDFKPFGTAYVTSFPTYAPVYIIAVT